MHSKFEKELFLEFSQFTCDKMYIISVFYTYELQRIAGKEQK